MKKPLFGHNFAVFLLFFGVAALEAFRAGDWLMAAMMFAIGLVFLAADASRKTDR